MDVRADSKDARLLSLRNEVLRTARDLDEAEDRGAAAVLRAGLSVLRTMATLPVAVGAARAIVETMHGTEDEADRSAHRKFHPATALQPMADAALASAHGETLLTFRRRFMFLAEGWENGTPMSEKLAGLAARLGDEARRAILVLPDRHIATIYDLSDAAQAAPWHVAEPRTMMQARTAGCRRRCVLVFRPGREDGSRSGTIACRRVCVCSRPGSFASLESETHAERNPLNADRTW